jgi:hypothetical protein
MEPVKEQIPGVRNLPGTATAYISLITAIAWNSVMKSSEYALREAQPEAQGRVKQHLITDAQCLVQSMVRFAQVHWVIPARSNLSHNHEILYCKTI